MQMLPLATTCHVHYDPARRRSVFPSSSTPLGLAPQRTSSTCRTSALPRSSACSRSTASAIGYELSRYHILGVDLVAPIDHYFQITRKKGRRHVPAGTLDHLIISMGIQLVQIHGQDNVVLVTTDDRLARIVEKCRSGLPTATVKKLKLQRASEITGKQFSQAIFPRCIDLSDATRAELQETFGAWPPPTGPKVKAYRWP